MGRLSKNMFLFSIPFLLLVIAYVWADPFKVIYYYDNYYEEVGGGATNRGYVSTMNYLNKKDTYHYDSFIFGNSRSMYYRIEDWKKHIGNETSCYHFSESGGSLNGYYYKMKLIDDCGGRIKNALVVMDVWMLQTLDKDGALFIIPPILVNNSNIVRFHLEHFVQWMKLRFLICWFDYKLTGTFKNYMNDVLMRGGNNRFYNPITNEEPRGIEDSLMRAGKYYTEERMIEFGGQVGGSFHKEDLNVQERVDVLKKMAYIFRKHHTDYRIIMSPMWDQMRLNPKDYETLCNIFGKNHVYDMTGINKWTSDYHYHYEYSHYTPQASAEVMDSIYSNCISR